MNMHSIQCGRISYINVLPLYYPLEQGIVKHSFHFIYAPPAELNKKIHEGGLDLSPVSSVEYIRYSSQYRIIPDLSISCMGSVMSVLLFSHVPIEELDRKKIALTTESDTSILLLQVLLAERYSLTPEYISLTKEMSHDYSAVLLIGDSALREREITTYPYIYDLGEVWYRWTSLPFVFALWVVPHTTQYNKEIALPFYSARDWSEENRAIIYKNAKESTGLTDKLLKEYYSCLRYSFGEMEQESICYFTELLYKHMYCTTKPTLRFL
ncbi:MAG: menaquinone biosynthesis protein [Desulfovibrionaceae bacterium]|nr:menaquinone biosynthesis protein [Desulfovibrionaceae bacterium]